MADGQRMGAWFAAFFIVILFSSCAMNEWSDSVITNNSEFYVVFKFTNTDEFDLAVGETKTFKTEAYQYIESYFPINRVFFSYKITDEGYTGEFKALPSWKVKVDNTLEEKATLKANLWMDGWQVDDWWMDEMKDIEPGMGGSDYNENHTGRIFLSNPRFTVITESGLPAVARYYLAEIETEIENETEKTMFVIIEKPYNN